MHVFKYLLEMQQKANIRSFSAEREREKLYKLFISFFFHYLYKKIKNLLLKKEKKKSLIKKIQIEERIEGS